LDCRRYNFPVLRNKQHGYRLLVLPHGKVRIYSHRGVKLLFGVPLGLEISSDFPIPHRAVGPVARYNYWVALHLKLNVVNKSK
jgi:hypothetical protein